ncbi:hypothetical protein [Streptomyces sp. NBC_00328]|uniref:hypothetical protein n=1 Tax=Streptomyces sp. NBC_00328 TaxID=2903646 RepID=UPI002E284CB7|nr:hypothetical protein [Streptomyces sp. NBC_00328]
MLKRPGINRTFAAGALALVTAATGVAFAPVASAAPQACVGSSLTTGGYEGVGTIRNKSASSTCGDLNLTYSYNSTSAIYDYYAGRLRRSNGTWFTCSAGYVYAQDGYHSINDDDYWLCTDVGDNTPFTVASWSAGGDTVTITH